MTVEITTTRMVEKQKRLKQANQVIEIIAAHGRKFFEHEGRISFFTLDDHGRVWFTDKYSLKQIYTHYEGHWRGFSEGGTLRSLVIALRDYISKGDRLPACHFGKWPNWYSEGDPWGYGEDMAKVRTQVDEMGILQHYPG